MQISHFPCDPRESHQPSVMGWGCGGMEQPALLSASGWEQATSVFLPHWREIPFCLLWLGSASCPASSHPAWWVPGWGNVPKTTCLFHWALPPNCKISCYYLLRNCLGPCGTPCHLFPAPARRKTASRETAGSNCALTVL